MKKDYSLRLSNEFKIWIIILIILTIIGCFFIITIREGHDWGGDFSMYIHHAKNIVEGKNYKDTGYISNPLLYPPGSPEAYPPLYPLLLSPIYKYFGLNLKPMKIEIILIFIFALFLIFLTFKNELPSNYLILMIVVIGFHPYFWSFKDNILSEIPFLFFLFLLFFIIKRYNHEKNRNSRYYYIIIGILSYFCYATRSIGIVVIPSLLLYEIIKFRKIPFFSIKVFIIFIFLVLLQDFLIPSGNVYINYLLKTNYRVAFSQTIDSVKIIYYFWSWAFLFLNSIYNKIIVLFIFILLSLFSIIGYLLKIKDSISIIDIFFTIYIMSTIIYPSGVTIRYYFPVIPIYIYYTFYCIKKINCFLEEKSKRTIFIVLIAFFACAYIVRYSQLDYGPLNEGITKKESIELFNYIKEKTEKNAIFIFKKPRVLSLFTGRKASFYHFPTKEASLLHKVQVDEDVLNFFYKIKASYIIVGQIFSEDKRYLIPLIEKYRENFNEVYSNQDFKVYKINRL